MRGKDVDAVFSAAKLAATKAAYGESKNRNWPYLYGRDTMAAPSPSRRKSSGKESDGRIIAVAFAEIEVVNGDKATAVSLVFG